jgi:hypothetical protein
MAQVSIRSNDAATYVGVESTYGTLPTVRRLTPIAGSVNIVPQQDDLAVLDESVYLHDNKRTARGLKSNGSTASFQCYLKALSSLLTSSTLDAPAVYRDVMRALLGGMSPAQGGNVGGACAVAAGTASAVDVVSAANFAAGQWVMVETANGMEPARIASIASTTLTMNPALATAPSSSGDVAHCITLYLSDSNTLSLSLQHAKAGSSDEQYELRGCTGDLEIQVARGAQAMISVNLRAGDWSRGALSISTAVGADTTGNCYASIDDAVFLLQAASTATPTNYYVEECTFSVATGMVHVPALNGPVSGTQATMRTGDRVGATATVTIRMDPDQITNWSNQTELQLWLQIPLGTGATRQWLVVGMPKCRIVGVPQPNVSSDNRVRYQLTLQAHIDASAGSELLRSPFIVAVG